MLSKFQPSLKFCKPSSRSSSFASTLRRCTPDKSFIAVSHSRNDALSNLPEVKEPSKIRSDSGNSRRASLLAAVISLTAILPGQSQAADQSPVVKLWRGIQAQNGGIKIIAPLRVAKRRLLDIKAVLEAMPEVTSSAAVFPSLELGEVLTQVRTASMNCYAYDGVGASDFDSQASLAQQTIFRSNLSDPCTFRIIVKSSTSFAGPEIRATSYATLDQLISSYEGLDLAVQGATQGSPGSLGTALTKLDATLSLLEVLEGQVKEALGVV